MATSIPRVRPLARRLSTIDTSYPRLYRHASWWAALYTPRCSNRKPRCPRRSLKPTPPSAPTTEPSPSKPSRNGSRCFHGWGRGSWHTEDLDARYERMREEMDQRRRELLKERGEAFERLRRRIQEHPYDGLFGWTSRFAGRRWLDGEGAAQQAAEQEGRKGAEEPSVVSETVEGRGPEAEYDPISGRMVTKERDAPEVEGNAQAAGNKDSRFEPPKVIEVQPTKPDQILLKDDPVVIGGVQTASDRQTTPVPPESSATEKKPENRLAMPDDDLDFLQSSDVRASMALASEANYRSDADRERERLELENDYQELQRSTVGEEIPRPVIPTQSTVADATPGEQVSSRVESLVASHQRGKRIDQILQHLDNMTGDLIRQQRHIEAMHRAMSDIEDGVESTAVEHPKALDLEQEDRSPATETSVTESDENKIQAISKNDVGRVTPKQWQTAVDTGSSKLEVDHATETALRDLVGRTTEIESRLETLSDTVASAASSQVLEQTQATNLDSAAEQALHDIAQRVSAVDARLERITALIDQLPSQPDASSTAIPTADPQTKELLAGISERLSEVDCSVEWLTRTVADLRTERTDDHNAFANLIDMRLANLAKVAPMKAGEGPHHSATGADADTAARLRAFVERLEGIQFDQRHVRREELPKFLEVREELARLSAAVDAGERERGRGGGTGRRGLAVGLVLGAAGAALLGSAWEREAGADAQRRLAAVEEWVLGVKNREAAVELVPVRAERRVPMSPVGVEKKAGSSWSSWFWSR